MRKLGSEVKPLSFSRSRSNSPSKRSTVAPLPEKRERPTHSSFYFQHKAERNSSFSNDSEQFHRYNRVTFRPDSNMEETSQESNIKEGKIPPEINDSDLLNFAMDKAAPELHRFSITNLKRIAKHEGNKKEDYNMNLARNRKGTFNSPIKRNNIHNIFGIQRNRSASDMDPSMR